MLITKNNLKMKKGYAYNGDDKYPCYILRGKKIDKNLAEKIIIAETPVETLKSNYDVKNFYRNSIKKPESIRETIERMEVEEEQNKGEQDTQNQEEPIDFFDDEFNEFVENSPINSFVDVFGNVGADGTTYKYPMPYEFLIEHTEYAAKYPFLSYVIIYMDYAYIYDKVSIDVYPPLLNNISQKLNGFTYALHIHDGGVEIVNKKEAINLYEKYQKEYSNNFIFKRSEYNEYVQDLFTTYELPLLLKNWEIEPSLEKEIKKVYKIKSTIKNIDKNIKLYKNTFVDNEYQKIKKMYKELKNIYDGKSTKLKISKKLYKTLKEYLNLVFEYHEQNNQAVKKEIYLKKVLSKKDFRLIHSVIYEYKYNLKSIEFVYESEKNKKVRNIPIEWAKQEYELKSNMYRELEAIRKDEKTNLNYNKTIIKKIKDYLETVVGKEGVDFLDNNLKPIWKMEGELQSQMDHKMYQLMADTILFTKSSSYDIEKEYQIYNECRELANEFMRDVKQAVKTEDFELKTINENSYIEKYDKLQKDYKKIIKTCLNI